VEDGEVFDLPEGVGFVSWNESWFHQKRCQQALKILASSAVFIKGKRKTQHSAGVLGD
jgi:hypothetical protein